MGILVSKLDHCLWDLLIRHHSGELTCDIPRELKQVKSTSSRRRSGRGGAISSASG